MDNPLISVIVPVYNVEKYLPKCIDSIINQTYKNLEIILVDDGSPDNSPQICDDYAKKDSRIKVIHKKNGGRAEARNVAIDVAKGEYIGFVDSDDYIADNFYELLLKAALDNNADISICSSKCVDEEDKEVESIFHFDVKDEVLDKKEALGKLVKGNLSFVTLVTKLYHKKLFNNVRYPLGVHHEDEYFAHHIIGEADRVVCISDEIYYYLVTRTDSFMHEVNPEKTIDSLYAAFDRYKCVKSLNYEDLANIQLNQVYGKLILCIKQLDLKKYKKEIKKYVNIVFKLYFPKKEAFKILGIYFKKVLKV